MDGDPEIRRVNPKDLSPGPLRHDSLTAGQVERLRDIYDYVSPYLNKTFEQFEIDFLRDENPDTEMGVWEKIVQTHRVYLDKHPTAAISDGENVFRCVLCMSLGAGKPESIDAALWKRVNEFCSGK